MAKAKHHLKITGMGGHFVKYYIVTCRKCGKSEKYNREYVRAVMRGEKAWSLIGRKSCQGSYDRTAA